MSNSPDILQQQEVVMQQQRQRGDSVSSPTQSQKPKSSPCVLLSSNGGEFLPDSAISAAYQNALEDVHTRFLLNLPIEELATADRILFQIEQAWWFYEDWICDKNDEDNNKNNNSSNNNDQSDLPRFKHLKAFAIEMFHFSPLLDIGQFQSMWEQFSKYKRTISTYGTICLNVEGTHVLLCQEWNSRAWTFPSGKINQGEQGIDAAARETYEETGFHPNGLYGLSKDMITSSSKFSQNVQREIITWDFPLKESNALVYVEDSGKRRTNYVCHGVPMDFPFQPIVRKEVAEIKWHNINSIPKKSYAVTPFISQLKRWMKRNNIRHNKSQSRSRESRERSSRSRGGGKGGHDVTPNKQRRDASRNKSSRSNTPTSNNSKGGGGGTSNNRSGSSGRNSSNRKSSSRGRRTPRNTIPAVIDSESDSLVVSGLAEIGDANGWSEEDMFTANERLLGRKIEYDGNPHVFAENGFGGKDPHAFHVVGGNFMNSGSSNNSTSCDSSDTSGSASSGGGICKLAPPPPVSKLQPLFRDNTAPAEVGEDGEIPLTPFFNTDGVTPWGEIVEQAAGTMPTTSPEKTSPTKKEKKKKTKNKKKSASNEGEELLAMLHSKSLELEQQQKEQDDDNDIFLTDRQITNKSQKEKLGEIYKKDEKQKLLSRYEYENDIQAWVQNLPKGKPTKHFGQFHFDVDAIMSSIQV